ncbi:DUF5914 domain-containing protein [Actinopolymorpha singaporensis]|uniref:Rieske [2Fe-2S] domain-containing protein n=1 Tax=Actinopolymorpha singaporensis TaxID=117157 RepID=A0A1H1M6K3_9ACTN|nr:DUF5914 domain-containing protein [Actinopolymorpha singaporensis]SDR82408.1 Rieske [2Fe-2S] domain-containing protein [Actinopolymorpha singaporensis]
MAGRLSERVAGKIPLRRMAATRWAEQTPTWEGARPGLIEAALKRAEARPSGNWFVLASSAEVRADKPFGRTVAGVELVAWRTPDGAPHAGPGACPHLGAPLCQAAVDAGKLICRWHGLGLGAQGFPGWDPYPVHDDGVLCWVRLDGPGGEEPLPAPVLPARPDVPVSIDAVTTMVGRCEPADVVANRLDPWHGAWFHPYSFAHLKVLDAPRDPAPEDDNLVVEVTFRVAGRVGVPVRVAFSCPEPRTVVMHILDGEGATSAVETHATPLGPDEQGRPLTAVIEATIAYSGRPGFALARRVAPAVRPLMRVAARRLWKDDLAYAERRYELRSTGRFPG